MEVSAFRYVSVKAVLALLLGIPTGLTSCGGDDSGGRVQGRDKPLPDQVISDFRITMTSMGQKDWSMEAEKAFVYENRNVLEARSIEVTFFDEAGEARSVLQADYGKLNRNSNDMEARGNVIVTASDGVILETESLSWQSGTRKITSDDSVRVVRHEDVLTGLGFRGDPDLGSFEIRRNMRATIKGHEDIAEDGGDHGSDTQD